MFLMYIINGNTKEETGIVLNAVSRRAVITGLLRRCFSNILLEIADFKTDNGCVYYLFNKH